jgi:REP element-mobilizing transposase RayT
LLGSIIDGEPVFSLFGHIAQNQLLQSPQVRPGLELDCWVVMPNHLHMVVILTADENNPDPSYHRERWQRERRSISSFVAGYKAAVTSAARHASQKIDLRLWQPGFYDHVVRTEDALQAIRQYVIDNPAKWELDSLYPRAAGRVDSVLSVVDAEARVPLL